ncbi:hypothetical protein VIGAN_01286700 [Vigna angularis var. angularis]|uniref:Uncharacterized protein n=1 Tax=Vigna angularis var. angularis TaxID=157739 RepID=A0A0S3R3I7_PHAAN|nr:hypothetical protein VIGAN_01286700 [Vigna angularis var. angularis]
MNIQERTKQKERKEHKFNMVHSFISYKQELDSYKARSPASKPNKNKGIDFSYNNSRVCINKSLMHQKKRYTS